MFYRFFLAVLTLTLCGCIAGTAGSSFEQGGIKTAATSNDKIACTRYTEPRTRMFSILTRSNRNIQRKELEVLKLCSPKFETVTGLPPFSNGESLEPPFSKLQIIFDISPTGKVTNARYFHSDHEHYYKKLNKKLTLYSIKAVEDFIFGPQKGRSGALQKTSNVIMTFKFYRSTTRKSSNLNGLSDRKAS